MAWFLRRIGVSLLLVWVVVTVVFMAIHLVPGDPAELLLSQGGAAPDPAAVTALRHQLGLDRPLLAQYVTDLDGLVHGNLGESLQDQSPVTADIAQRLPRTLELLCAASVLALGIGVPLGTLAGIAPGGALDRTGSAASALFLSVPVFVVGTLLVLVFAEQLGWAAAGGFVAFDQSPGGHFAHLAMPAITIALGLGAMLFRITRASVLDVAMRDYVRTARAKGVGSRRILWRHVLRNALSPIVTVFGLQFGALIGGTVLVEYVFNYPGLSGLLVDAVDARDYPMVQGIVLVISVLFVAINLALDLLYAALDPRVRGR